MTMTRTTYTEHTAAMQSGPHAGYTKEQFAMPQLRRTAIAERGHAYMTRAEYAGRRMHRGAIHPSMIADKRYRVASVKRAQRTIGGRRITGYQPGTKTPCSYAVEDVQRRRRVRLAG